MTSGDLMAPVDSIKTDAQAGRGSFPPRLLVSALLVLAYVLIGRLGLLLAVQPGYATAVFLPAGIAIAASLMLGAAVLPAIFVGSFLLNVWVGSSIEHELDTTAISIALIIASASALQAAIGGTLLRRVIGYPAPMDTARDVATFLVLAPVICVVSATLSLTGIWAVHAVAPPELLVNWLTWWVGDTLGTLVALPLVLVLVGEPRLLWRSRARFVAAPMVLCFALFVGIFVRVSTWETDASLFEFKLQSQRVAERIKTNLEEQALFLDQLASVFISQGGALTRSDFDRLVDRLLHQYPTIHAVEWAPRISSAERASFEAAQRTEIPSFAIRERGASGGLVPAVNDKQFYPVTYVQPLAGNEQALGFDLSSDPYRRAAIEAANKNGDVVATAPIRLVQEHEGQSGILLVRSVPDSATGPCVVLVVLRMGTFTRMLAEPLKSTLNVRFTDSAVVSQPFFDSLIPSSPANYGTAFDFAGRRYLVQTAPTAHYLAQHRGWQGWAVLAAGVLSTGLLGALLILGTGHAYRVEKMAQARQQLATIVEASRDAIWSWTNDGIITSWNPEAERMFGYTAQEIIGKSIVTLIPADRIKLAYDIIGKVSQGQSYVPWETFRIRKDGAAVPVELTVSPIHDSEGRVVGAATVCRNIAERKQANARIAADLQDMTRLNELSNMFVRQAVPMDDILTAAVDTAIALAGAEKGNLQVFNPAIGTFTIAAQRGFDAAFLAFFDSPRDDASAAAMQSGARVVVEDVESSEIFLGQPSQAVMLDAGVRAVISTPLMSSTGTLLGIFSTHFSEPHRPEERELRLLDLLARQTADYLERKGAEEVATTLLHEVQHRSNNLLAIIQTIAARSLSENHSLAEAKASFEGRLQALARSNRKLTDSALNGVSVSEIVRSQLEPFAGRILVDGTDILLGRQDAQNFALVLHELATNATKHGALSTVGGKVYITWSIIDHGKANALKFRWHETEGPPISKPTRYGFGTTLLKATFPDARIEYPTEGLICEIHIPLGGLGTRADADCCGPGALGVR
jgi:PAS domain S-box-containing protein